jgi:5-methylcytosine-specific restriction endonuclease McrA
MATKPRQYKKDWLREQERAAVELPRRAARARARRAADKAGLDRRGKDLDHKVPLSLGGSTKMSNVRAVSPSANRSFPRQANGKPKRKGA